MKIERLLISLFVSILLLSCNDDAPIVAHDEPTICFSNEGGVFLNDEDGVVINGIVKIFGLDVVDSRLYVYGKDMYGNFVIWHDGYSQIIEPPECPRKLNPPMMNGEAIFLDGSIYSESYFSITCLPSGKKFQLPRVAGAFPRYYAVNGDEYFACGYIEPSLDVAPGAVVWVNGEIIRLSTGPSVNIVAINGYGGHYYAVGPCDITMTDMGYTVWTRMGYWRDGVMQELDRRDSNHAWVRNLHMHGAIPIIYGYLAYDEMECRACVWIDGEYMDLSQGRDTWVKAVRSCGNDWYAFVYDYVGKYYQVWRNGEPYKAFRIQNVTHFAVY